MMMVVVVVVVVVVDLWRIRSPSHLKDLLLLEHGWDTNCV